MIGFAAIGVRSYVSEPDRGRRHWKGQAAARDAVYANRRRIRGAPGETAAAVAGRATGTAQFAGRDNSRFDAISQALLPDLDTEAVRETTRILGHTGYPNGPAFPVDVVRRESCPSLARRQSRIYSSRLARSRSPLGHVWSTPASTL